MANDKLSELSMDFSVQIINLVKYLREQRETIISNQIGRSGTSIGANIREANSDKTEIIFGVSNKDYDCVISEINTKKCIIEIVKCENL